MYLSQNTIITKETSTVRFVYTCEMQQNSKAAFHLKKKSSKEDRTFACLYPLVAKYLQITFGFDNAKSL